MTHPEVSTADLLTLSPAQAWLHMQTSWPWVHHTNYKAMACLHGGIKVYAEFFLIRKKSYKTKEMFSYLIFK